MALVDIGKGKLATSPSLDSARALSVARFLPFHVVAALTSDAIQNPSGIAASLSRNAIDERDVAPKVRGLRPVGGRERGRRLDAVSVPRKRYPFFAQFRRPNDVYASFALIGTPQDRFVELQLRRCWIIGAYPKRVPQARNI